MKRIGNVVLALLVLLFGALYGMLALLGLEEWPAISGSFAVCLVLISLFTLTMVVCGLWVLVTLGKAVRPLLFAGIGTAGTGFVIAAGTLAKMIPCGGPD